MTSLPLTANPLREGLRLPRTPDPCAVVVFGATGDLTARKLVPALYNLARERLLPGGFSVVGDRKSTRLNSSHLPTSRMPSSA